MAEKLFFIALLLAAALTLTTAQYHWFARTDLKEGSEDYEFATVEEADNGADEGSGEDPFVHVQSSHFAIDEIMDAVTLDGFINMDEKEEHSADMVGHMFGRDLLEVSKEFSHYSKDLGRSVPLSSNNDCRTFCLQFYNWCKDAVCLELIKDENTSVIEVLPCITSCTVHTATCCFS